MYLDVPISAKDLKGKLHPNILSLHYQQKFMDVGFEDSFSVKEKLKFYKKCLLDGTYKIDIHRGGQ